MKKFYTKPLISVEAMDLDQPIAAGSCQADKDDINSMIDVGFFGSGSGECEIWLGSGDEGEGGKYDWDRDGVWDGVDQDGICYHSNVLNAFLS